MGALYIDQKYRTAGRGYGYVGVSRFRTRGGCYIYGHLRRTYFLPAGGEGAEVVLERGYDSLSDDDEDGRGLEFACEGNGAVFDCEVDIADLANDDDVDDDFA